MKKLRKSTKGKESSQPMSPDTPELKEAMELIEQRNRERLQDLRRLSATDDIFPDVHSSPYHTVVGIMDNDDIRGASMLNLVVDPREKFVPLPCENEHLWKKITEALNCPLLKFDDITNAVNKYTPVHSDYSVLDYAINNLMSEDERDKFFTEILPGMAKLCLRLPELISTRIIPLLLRSMNHSITLSQLQVACLLTNAFFSTFRKGSDDDHLPSINFTQLLSNCKKERRLVSQAHKIRCIIHYFERVLHDMPNGVVSYTRKSIAQSELPEWSQVEQNLCPLITLHSGVIEKEGERLLEVDFANKNVGGGVLGHGCVQEEILFVIYPELIISRLFTERLDDNDALLITGCERFSEHKGYADTFEFIGNFVDTTPRSAKGRRCTQFVSMDATNYRRFRKNVQYSPEQFTREVNKAYIGFSSPSEDVSSSVAVATGKWGCGAYMGNPHLKTILQLLAASKAGRSSLVFFTFGDVILQKELEELYEVIQDKPIRDIWNQLEKYNALHGSHTKPKLSLFQFLMKQSKGGTYGENEPIRGERVGEKC